MQEPQAGTDPLLGVVGFVDALADDPTPEGLARTLEANSGAKVALVTYLESRFVQLDRMTELENHDEWWMALEILAAQWGEAERKLFLDRVGLRAAAPEGYRWLANFFRAAVPVSELEPWLLRGIEQGDETEQLNASHLGYYLFDGTPGYELSAAGQDRLAAADAALGR